MKSIVIAVGLLQKKHKILLSQRLDDAFMGGFWELAGGKVEKNETIFNALKREMFEELNIEVISTTPFRVLKHSYPDRKVEVHIFKITDYNNEPISKEGQKIKWVTLDELKNFKLLPTMQNIINSLSIPQLSWITPNNLTLTQIEEKLNKGIKLIQLRGEQELSIKSIYDLCKQYQAKLILNQKNMDFSRNDVDGFHLNSKISMALKQRPFTNDKILSVATHNKDELNQASLIQADFCYLSPVLATTSHPNATPLGWDKITKLIQNAKLPVVLLGGLNENNLKDALAINAQGIAGISYIAIS
jgi:8-oxo-dGTP diphosphatase